MICYLIQCHHLSEQVGWLVNQLQDKDNSFVISVDGPDHFYQEIVLKFYGRDDVHVIRSMSVTWCGASQVIALLDGIRVALQQFEKWEMLINLSGQCFPLQPQRVIKKFLVSAIAQDKKLFMSVFKPRYFAPILQKRDFRPQALLDVSIFDAKGTRCRIHPELISYFQNWSDSPVMKPYLRSCMWVAEDPLEKSLYVRPLYVYEARYREHIMKRWPHYCGRAWYMLHRSFLEWLASSPRTDEMFNLFSTIFEPDESFIQTLVMCESKWTSMTVNNNYRLNEGKPIGITDEMLSLLDGSDAFFGRKLMFDKSLQFQSKIEALRLVRQ